MRYEQNVIGSLALQLLNRTQNSNCQSHVPYEWENIHISKCHSLIMTMDACKINV